MRSSLQLLSIISTVFVLPSFLISSISAHDDGASHLWIVRPDTLLNQYPDDDGDSGYLTHREALFGIPSYGEDITAPIFYATPGAEDYGCDPFADSKVNQWHSDGGDFLLLIDRGVCNFVKKVRNAEEAGAVGVIIADKNCLAGDPFGYCDDYSHATGGTSTDSPGTCANGQTAHGLTCPGGSTSTVSYLPYMANDGSGDNIRIPSFIISKFDAQNIKSALCEQGDKSTCSQNVDHYTQRVVLQMEWDVPSDDDHVTWEMWTSSEDWYGSEFKLEFARVAKDLEESTTFTPHYLHFDGTRWGCRSSDGTNQCPDNCVLGGKYCSDTPRGGVVEGHLKGIDVVQENLRQLCVFDVVSQTDDEYKYWDYIVDFADRCFGEEGITSENFKQCSDDVANANGIDSTKVDQCVTSSGASGVADGTNTKLEAEMTAANQLTIFELPSFIINGVEFRGSNSFGPVLTGICNAFMDDTEPKVCDSVLNPGGGEQGLYALVVDVYADWDMDNFKIEDFNWQLQSEFRSQMGFKAGVVKTSVEIKNMWPNKEGHDLLVSVLFRHLTMEEADNARDMLMNADKNKDLKFYTANSQAEQTQSVLVTCSLGTLTIKSEAEINNNNIVNSITGGSETSPGVIVMMVIFAVCMAVLAFAVIALWRRVGLTSRDLNIFSDMMAVPKYRSMDDQGAQMREVDPTGQYQRPLADADYAQMPLNGDDDDDDEQESKQGVVAVSVDEVAL